MLSASHKLEGLLGLGTSNWRRLGSEGQLPDRLHVCTECACLCVCVCTNWAPRLTASWTCLKTQPLSSRLGRQFPRIPTSTWSLTASFYTSSSFSLHHPYNLFCTPQLSCRRVPRCERPFAAAMDWHARWLCNLQPSRTQRVGRLPGKGACALWNWAALLFVGVTTARDTSNSAPVAMNAF